MIDMASTPSGSVMIQHQVTDFDPLTVTLTLHQLRPILHW